MTPIASKAGGDAMLCDEPIDLKETHGPLGPDESCEPGADGTPPRARTFLGAILCGVACACGGGGYTGCSGGSNNPPPPPASATLLYVPTEAAVSLDSLTSASPPGVPT